MDTEIRNIIKKNQVQFHPVVPFDTQKDKVVALNLKDSNSELSPPVFNNIDLFNDYLDKMRKTNNADYLVGGYNEFRSVYSRSRLFDTGANTAVLDSAEPRRLHLGIDIWGPEGTTVSAPLGGMLHSFAYNNNYGDYGATIVLLHQLDGLPFYTLYGHLSLRDIDRLNNGEYVTRGAVIGHFGSPDENGHWPPHLHFQIILDMELYTGDYPGVCKYSEREKYLANCPDPDLILQMNKWL